ncbi:OmpA family protein [Parendozoicomonas sp. Alg238-R29]|uniref:OmpA family protein n=1 Tax=Parendozoicomonas sp. Alg238-R29 TaxID=2993446 RepID=UPI00248ED1CD|nr:OmpA family protein [Parendozoicomonas sp. Alg238-R29]
MIELVETEEQPMFQRSEYQLTPFFEDLLLELAPKLVNSGAELAIIGHADSTSYTGRASFENSWSVSYARANSVRELMDFVGMPEKSIVQVSGMADSQHLIKTPPQCY